MNWSKEDIDFLHKNYGILKTSIIANYLNRNTKTVSTKAQRLKLKSKLTNKKYSINNDIFNIITNNTCYWAGFIASDGCISQKGKFIRLSFGQKISDIEILNAFKVYINSDFPIKTNTKFAKFEITDISCWIPYLKFYYNLQENNKTYIKSYNLNSPNLINIEHKLSYIIGYIDGDGSISNKKVLRLGFYGTKDILTWISKTLFEIEDQQKYQNPAKVSKGNGGYSISYTYQRARKIIEKLKEIKISYRLNRKWNVI